MGLKHGWATVAVILFASAFGASILLCAFLCFCYFPGGRKKSAVMSVGEYPEYSLKQLEEEDRQGSEDIYYEMMPKDGKRSDQENQDWERRQAHHGGEPEMQYDYDEEALMAPDIPIRTNMEGAKVPPKSAMKSSNRESREDIPVRRGVQMMEI